MGNEAIEWGKTLEKVFRQYQADNPNAIPTGSKRSTPAQGLSASGGNKKVKTEAGDGISEEEMRKLWHKGQISGLTVAELKTFCGLRKIAVAGKKADLVDRIEAWLEQK